MSITPDGPDSPKPPHAQPAGWVNRTCPRCGTINPSRAAACWHCNALLGGSGDETYREIAPPNPFKRHLAVVVGVCLTILVLLGAAGILNIATGVLAPIALALFLCAAMLPALTHLFSYWARTSDGASEPLNFWSGVHLVLVGMIHSGLIVAAGAVVFVATCTPISLVGPSGHGFGPTDNWLIISSGVGIGAAGAITYLLVRSLFRKPPRPDSPQRGDSVA